MMSSWFHQMYMNRKVNQGPLYDISVWCNTSFKTKLHPIRLHTTKNISPSPTLQFGGVFCIDVDQGSLINKKNWKIALACLFFVVDALIWCLSQQISVKKAFLSRTERFGSFLFCFFYSNLGLPRTKSLQNERLGFLSSRRKIEPVTTHKMASYLMDVNIIFQENMCLTNLNHYKHSEMTIFWVRFNTEKNRNCI